MKKNFFIILLFFTFHLLRSDQFTHRCVVPSLKIENPDWEFNFIKIHQSSDGACAELLSKTNQMCDDFWDKINQKVYDELEVTIQGVVACLSNQYFAQTYMNYYAAMIPEQLGNVENTDPVVANYIEMKKKYLHINQPLSILSGNNITVVTSTWGNDLQGFYFLYNNAVYNRATIENIYELASNQANSYHITDYTDDEQSQVIDCYNLYQCGIAQAFSSIVHQSDFLTHLVRILRYNNKILSYDTQLYISDFLVFLSFLESSLQAKNPLEVALFLQPQSRQFHIDFIVAFEQFIKNIQNSYHPDDVKNYLTYIQAHRIEQLYAESK